MRWPSILKSVESIITFNRRMTKHAKLLLSPGSQNTNTLSGSVGYDPLITSAIFLKLVLEYILLLYII